MTESPLKHWYLFAFSTPAPGHVAMASVIAGLDNSQVTVPVLIEMRRTHQIPETAVVVGISYLGYMTQETMEGPKPVEQVQQGVSDVYLSGYKAGLLGTTARSLNPYNAEDNQAAFVSWDSGFDQGTHDRIAAVPQ